MDDGLAYTWQDLLSRFVSEWQAYYEGRQAQEQGMHGFIQAFLCAITALPPMRKSGTFGSNVATCGGSASRLVMEMLEFMLQTANGGVMPALQSAA